MTDWEKIAPERIWKEIEEENGWMLKWVMLAGIMIVVIMLVVMG